jgi:hypothetical protein
MPRAQLAALSTNARPEIEIVFSPGSGKFSGKAECNLLVVLKESAESRRLARQAHVLVSDDDVVGPQVHRKFPLGELREALKSAA